MKLQRNGEVIETKTRIDISAFIAAVCFLSIVILPWIVLLGNADISWRDYGQAALIWLVIGSLAGLNSMTNAKTRRDNDK